jgi:dihydrofolate synthase/folylpolyglutamate synthase
MKYREAIEYVEGLSSLGIRPGLARMIELCRRLGNPQDTLKMVHIAGTNGKGSVLAFISSVFRKAGYRVGCYISPVIFEYREKISINGKAIGKAMLGEGMELLREASLNVEAEGLGHPTAFEIETALAFWYFDKRKCDIVFLETGMGGREDATNVIRRHELAVVTPISRDHMKYLGEDIEAIALHKAGILKNDCPVVFGLQKPEVYQVLNREAAEKNCPVYDTTSMKVMKLRAGLHKTQFDTKDWGRIEIGLLGKYQVDNAVLALKSLQVLSNNGWKISAEAVREGMREAVWPGRFSVIAGHPLYVVDGAHNEEGARRLAESLEFYFTNRRIIFIIGMLQDKETEKVLAITSPYADQLITVTPPDNPRGMTAYDLAKEASAYHPQVTAADSLEEAAEMSGLLAGEDDVILAFGSLSYLGKWIEIIEGKTSGKAAGRNHGQPGKNKRRY